jgi:hypothetical protein
MDGRDGPLLAVAGTLGGRCHAHNLRGDDTKMRVPSISLLAAWQCVVALPSCERRISC